MNEYVVTEELDMMLPIETNDEVYTKNGANRN